MRFVSWAMQEHKSSHALIPTQRNAALLCLLGAFLPIFGVFAAIVIALVTLRKGARAGLDIATWYVIPTLVFMLPAGVTLDPFIRILLTAVVMWMMAMWLRVFASWASMLTSSTLVAMVLVAVFHGVMPEPSAYWLRMLHDSFYQHVQVPNATQADLQVIFFVMSKIATGGQLAFMLLMLWSNIFIARYFQAKLYNPGGLKQELREIQFTRTSCILFLMVLTMASYRYPMFIDMVPLIVIPMIIFGLAALHRFAAQRQSSRYIIGVFYMMLMVFFFPMVIVLSLIALTDLIFHLRGDKDGRNIT